MAVLKNKSIMVEHFPRLVLLPLLNNDARPLVARQLNDMQQENGKGKRLKKAHQKRAGWWERRLRQLSNKLRVENSSLSHDNEKSRSQESGLRQSSAEREGRNLTECQYLPKISDLRLNFVECRLLSLTLHLINIITVRKTAKENVRVLKRAKPATRQPPV